MRLPCQLSFPKVVVAGRERGATTGHESGDEGEARARCKRRELAPISTAALLETSHSAHVRV